MEDERLSAQQIAEIRESVDTAERDGFYRASIAFEKIRALLSAFDAQQLEITRLQAERDEAQRALETACGELGFLKNDLANAIHFRDKAEAECARLRAQTTVSSLALKLIQQRIAQHKESLVGWNEPDGHLIPTEPNPDERQTIRGLLAAAIHELAWAEGLLLPVSAVSPSTPDPDPDLNWCPKCGEPREVCDGYGTCWPRQPLPPAPAGSPEK